MPTRGRRTPQRIQDYILEVSRASPALTNSEIASQVENKFGEDCRVDKTTVGRIRQRHGLSGKWGVEDASLAAVRHWPELTETAKKLHAGVAGGAPLPQLLGFPWNSSPNQNGELVISEREEEPDSLATERSPLATALREHLPSHTVWTLLERWKTAVRALAATLRTAVKEAEIASDLHERGLITVEEIERGGVGFTRWYPASEILDSAERRLVQIRHLHGYEIWPPSRQRKWTLVWTRDASSHIVLAAFDDEVHARLSIAVHQELSQDMLAHPCLVSVDNAQQKLVLATGLVEAELEAISHWVVFPGGCSLYAGNT